MKVAAVLRELCRKWSLIYLLANLTQWYSGTDLRHELANEGAVAGVILRASCLGLWSLGRE